MASRTVLKQVDLRDFLPLSHLDRAFNRSGLCAYCEGRYNCSLSEDSGLVYECEDYRPAQEELAPMTFSTLVDEPEESLEDDTLHGLCAQCQKRDLCPLKYIRGGVWHCEEFQ